jgi:hypothetical protein
MRKEGISQRPGKVQKITIKKESNIMPQLYDIIEEPDESISVYEAGFRKYPEAGFATREDAEAYVDYRYRKDVARPKIEERTQERIRQLITQWTNEAAAEFNLELTDVNWLIGRAIEAVTDVMCPE